MQTVISAPGPSVQFLRPREPEFSPVSSSARQSGCWFLFLEFLQGGQ